VDPEKRVTMDEIKNHKWFKSNSNQLPEPFPVQIAHLTDPDDIDPEIIANLMTLGWETETDLIQAILSPEDNVEKVFYQFLYERKCDFLENGDDDDSSEINPAGPRRRADSFSAEFRERRSSNASPSRMRSQSPDPNSPRGSPSGKPLTVDIPNAAMNLMNLNNQKAKKGTDLPESPAGSTPKRSWFANLFNFKGAVLMVKTTNTPEEAMEEVKRCLNVHSIKFQPGSKEVALKCKYESTEKDKVAAGLKGCKFRIEVAIAAEGGIETDVIFMHQQGSGSSYKAIFEMIKNDLNLKDKKVFIPPTPPPIEKEKEKNAQ